MTDEQILQALKRLRVETGSLACFGCGREHNCGTHGCAILREAADLIERLTAENAAMREKVPQWISVEERMPIDRLKKYLVAFQDAGGPIVDMARYFPSDGWTCDNWDVPQALITNWMPLPEAPEEGDKHGKTD